MFLILFHTAQLCYQISFVFYLFIFFQLSGSPTKARKWPALSITNQNNISVLCSMGRNGFPIQYPSAEREMPPFWSTSQAKIKVPSLMYPVLPKHSLQILTMPDWLWLQCLSSSDATRVKWLQAPSINSSSLIIAPPLPWVLNIRTYEHVVLCSNWWEGCSDNSACYSIQALILLFSE